MSKALQSISIFIFLVNIPMNLFAYEIKVDAKYIYQIENYPEYFSDNDTVEYVLKQAHHTLMNTVKTLMENRLKNTKDIKEMNLEILKELRSEDDKFQNATEQIETIVRQNLSEIPVGFSLQDFLPKALIISWGSKISFNFKAGFGGHVMIGLVLLPLHVKVYDKETQKLVREYHKIELGLISWGGGDLGIGMGGGPRYRVGLTGIFTKPGDTTYDPEQISGAFFSFSKDTMLKGVGFNVKFGTINNFDKDDFFDYFFASVTWQKGYASTSEFHGNVGYVFKGSSIMSILETSEKVIMNRKLKELEVKLSNPPQ